MFGLRSIYSLVLGENNAADQARAMQESMSMQVRPGQAMQVPAAARIARLVQIIIVAIDILNCGFNQ